ncbi:MAG: 30S ribosomal protein S4 [Microgenomates bacterium OLB22]|nr:MAG: 30S ribosomal protein S4 [Microgenomates bacterium OLB22]
MRYTGPKNRLARREGTDLSLKTVGSKAHASLLKKLNIPPGQHGRSYKRKISDYGMQLREKQKIKRMYGISEKQMKTYFDHANRAVGNTAELLITFLEQRLDNVLFKLGFAPTRAAARQLVSHGHIEVNKKKVTIPSFQVSQKDVISFKREKTSKIPYIAELLEKKETPVPAWLERKDAKGVIKGQPSLEEFHDTINLQPVVEFYSR